MDQQIANASDLKRGSVIVVDDDEATRESLRELLESAGLEAVVFASGRDVLSRCASLPDDSVLLLDIGLPDESGIAVFESLGALGIAIPVIFMTGQPDLARKARRHASSAFAVLEKPLEDEPLLETIGKALAVASDADGCRRLRTRGAGPPSR